MKSAIRLALLGLLLTSALSAQNSRRDAAIRDYGQVINSMTLAANNLNTALVKAKSASSAARAIDGFSNQMAQFQSRLIELDSQNPELHGTEPPAELMGSIQRLETAMTNLAQTLAAVGEKYGSDAQFQESAARLAQTLGADDGEEEYEIEEYE